MKSTIKKPSKMLLKKRRDVITVEIIRKLRYRRCNHHKGYNVVFARYKKTTVITISDRKNDVITVATDITTTVITTRTIAPLRVSL